MKKLIVANWKMNPVSVKEARRLFTLTQKAAESFRNVKTVIAPPFPYLMLSQSIGHGISLASQDVFWEERGPYTGEVSGIMLRDLGVEYVIIGHSERREHMGETETLIRKKIFSALSSRLNVILCVGEKKRDSEGMYLRFIKQELKTALHGLKREYAKNLVIAYEPIWAVGTKKPARPEDAFEMVLFIQKVLSSLFSRKAASRIGILYGGSVSPDNTSEFLLRGHVQGLLVGGESLKPARFKKILNAANKA